MKIYVVVNSINQSMSPVMETSYHRTYKEAYKVYNDCVGSVGDDYTSVYLDELDIESMQAETLEAFEGNMDDVDVEDNDELEQQ